jgi:hypothetical protein
MDGIFILGQIKKPARHRRRGKGGEMTNKNLPWQCPDHPNARIKHSWDEKHYVFNGYPAGEGIKSKHKYECNECGMELAEEE